MTAYKKFYRNTFFFLGILFIFFQGSLSAVSLVHVLEFLPENPIILEAGSYDGHDTACLSSVFPKGTIHAFEPLPEYYDMLVKRLKNCKNVKLYPYALNTFTGTTTFFYNFNNPGSSSLLPSTIEFQDSYTDNPITVQCITLEDWFLTNNINHIDLLWLDMEGAEHMALSSYEQLFDTVSCIIIEINYLELRKGMSMNFQMEELFNKHGFVRTHVEGGENQNDQVWIKGSLLNKS